MRIKHTFHITIAITLLLLPDFSKAIKGLKGYKRHEYNNVSFYAGPVYNIYKSIRNYGTLTDDSNNPFQPQSGGINFNLRQFNGRGFMHIGVNVQTNSGSSRNSPELEYTRFISGTDSIDTNNDGSFDGVANVFDSTSTVVATGPGKDFNAFVITLSLGYYTSNLIKQPNWNKSAIVPSIGFGLSVSSENFELDTINTSKVTIGIWGGIQLEKQLTKRLSISVYGKGTGFVNASEFLSGVMTYGAGLEYYLD